MGGSVIDHSLPIKNSERVRDHQDCVRHVTIHRRESVAEIIRLAHAEWLHRTSERFGRVRRGLVDRVALDLVAEQITLEDVDALGLLQSVYRDPRVPLPFRMRAAALALPFESPEPAVTAYVSEDNFPERLERALARNQKGHLIEHRREAIDGVEATSR
jgi:hypothetical protein